jgi:Tfp pilus assembly protein PilN
MQYRAKQRILNRGVSNGRQAINEMLNILSQQGNANQNDPKISTLHQSERLRKKTQVTASAEERGAHSSIAGGIANFYSHSGNQWVVS